MKICAIHQPNFFPWLGYFDKIRRSHKFVVLDNVQYQKKGGTWSNRVAVIDRSGEKMWLTAPIVRTHGVWNINETQFQPTGWRKKIINTLQASYAKAPYFKELKDFVFGLIDYPSNDLLEYNFHALTELCDFLSLDCRKVHFASSLSVGSSSTQRLIDLAKELGCNTYLAGSGASGYQDDALFEQQGIRLMYQKFEHPVYRQINAREFVAGLSIIDAIFNIGDQVRKIIASVPG